MSLLNNMSLRSLCSCTTLRQQPSYSSSPAHSGCSSHPFVNVASRTCNGDSWSRLALWRMRPFRMFSKEASTTSGLGCLRFWLAGAGSVAVPLIASTRASRLRQSSEDSFLRLSGGHLARALNASSHTNASASRHLSNKHFRMLPAMPSFHVACESAVPSESASYAFSCQPCIECICSAALF